MYNKFQKYVVAQKALIIKNNKCLILEINIKLPALKRKNIKFWDLPGGRINKNENYIKALKRELKEELNIDKFKILNIVDYDIWRWEHLNRWVCGIIILVNADIKNIRISKEHLNYKWISEKEINKHKYLWPKLNRMIKKGFEYNKL